MMISITGLSAADSAVKTLFIDPGRHHRKHDAATSHLWRSPVNNKVDVSPSLNVPNWLWQTLIREKTFLCSSHFYNASLCLLLTLQVLSTRGRYCYIGENHLKSQYVVIVGGSYSRSVTFRSSYDGLWLSMPTTSLQYQANLNLKWPQLDALGALSPTAMFSNEDYDPIIT